MAFDVLRRTLQAGEHGLFLATAHPAKFEATRDPAEPLPAALAAAARARFSPGRSRRTTAALRAALLDLAHRLRS